MALGLKVVQVLSGQSEKVVLRDFCSALWPLACGVPQGSVLSPMVFNIYMKLLGEDIAKFRLQCHQYVGDVQLHLFSHLIPRMLGI